MERRTILRHLSDPGSILVGLAVFNLTITWMMELDRHTCTVGPYSTGASYLIEAVVPFVSSLFLSINRRWANLVALLVSGYFLGCTVRFLLIDNELATVLTDWSYTDTAHLSRQVVFTLIMFGYSAIWGFRERRRAGVRFVSKSL